MLENARVLSFISDLDGQRMKLSGWVCQLVGALAKALESLFVKPPEAVPSQLLSWPASLRHKMSSKPSPL